MADLLACALGYCQRGLAVIPVNGKQPLGKGWQSGRLTEAELRQAFQKLNGKATGIGVLGGQLSGNLVILDFDGQDWAEAFDYTLQCWPEFAQAPIVQTGSGKRHIWLRCPDLPPDFTRQEYRHPTLDAVVELRGNCTQTLAPPSRHPSGGQYEWLSDRAELLEVPFESLVSWLATWAAVEPQKPKTTPAQPQNDLLQRILERLDRGDCPPSKWPDARGEYWPLCPFHDDQHVGSFSLSERGYGCFSCGAQGGLLQLAKHLGIAPPADQVAFPQPVPISQVGGGDAALDWLWFGYLLRGGYTLLTSLWKGGKTTLLAHICKALEQGDAFLDLPVKAAKVLIISEESEAVWADRREKLSLADNIHLLCRPFRGKPTKKEWEGFVTHLATLVSQQGYDVVVIDPMQSFSPVQDENDSAQMMAALLPLQAIAEAGAAVLLLHHPNKTDANEGRASRGSGALTGFVDIIVEMRRFDPEHSDDTRRVLKAYSRHEATPPELVIELTQDGYRAIGTKPDIKQAERQAILLELLGQEAMTAEEIRAAWPDEPRPSRTTVHRDLQRMTAEGLLAKVGQGSRNDPYRFVSRSYTTPGGEMKSKDAFHLTSSHEKGEMKSKDAFHLTSEGIEKQNQDAFHLTSEGIGEQNHPPWDEARWL